MICRLLGLVARVEMYRWLNMIVFDKYITIRDSKSQDWISLAKLIEFLRENIFRDY